MLGSLAFAASPLGVHVEKNGFDATRLKTEKVTVYILVPSSMLADALPWLNMLTGVFGAAIGKPGPRSPVTMLIDAIEGRRTATPVIDLGFELMVRQSSTLRSA